MKRKNFVLILLPALILMTGACEKSKKKGDNIVPESFKVGISDAISRPDLSKKNTTGTTEEITGDLLYNQLRTLVWVGELSADIVNEALAAVKKLDIDGPMEFSYTSYIDFREKDVIVRQNVDYYNASWEYALFVADEDGSRAFQLFWNQKPLKGIAMLAPGNLFRTFDLNVNSLIHIEYSEEQLAFAGEAFAYDKWMLVSVTNLDSTSRNYMNKLRLFAGKAGDIVYLRGNSAHPYAMILDETRNNGICWSFVAKNNVVKDIAVAKVALPPVDINTLTGMWEDYSMENVLTAEIEKVYDSDPNLTSIVAESTASAKIPGYFTGVLGYVSCGSNVPAIDGFTLDFIDLGNMEPFIPSEVNGMNFSLVDPSRLK